MSTKVAVVGAGYWGPNIIRNLNQIPSCDMAVCCDLDEKRLAHMKRLYPNLKTTTDYDEVAGDATRAEELFGANFASIAELSRVDSEENLTPWLREMLRAW